MKGSSIYLGHTPIEDTVCVYLDGKRLHSDWCYVCGCNVTVMAGILPDDYNFDPNLCRLIVDYDTDDE